MLIADDHRLIVEGIGCALSKTNDFEVVGETTSGSQVLPLVRRTAPDLVLLDRRMPGVDGLTALEQIKHDHPAFKVAILSASSRPDRDPGGARARRQCLRPEERQPADLAASLRQSMSDNVFYALGLPPPGRPDPTPEFSLPSRKFDILKALVRGFSNQGVRRGRADRQVPPDHHPPQARSYEPHRDRHLVSQHRLISNRIYEC